MWSNMCAIAGIIGLTADEKTLGAMLQSMHRRGPDAEGIYSAEEATLLHARLIIRDPEGGKQPMHLTWAGEKYTIVYNGELYNTEEIRKELEEAGHTFLGYSDTEVVLHAYAQFGEGCLLRFNGIFAFGIWEEKRKRLFLARDRIGVKPLFYMRHSGGLLFASEMKTILEYPTVQARLDEQGAAQLILLGPGRLPGSGVFRDMEEIEPGCCAFYEDGRLNGRRYWKLTDGEHRESFGETLEHVRFLVTDAIRRQMVSDEPVGTFLSGGLDSSIITAICALEEAKQGRTLKTFSVDYRNNERFFQSNKFQPSADSCYIEIMRKAFGTDQHLTVLTPADPAPDSTDPGRSVSGVGGRYHCPGSAGDGGCGLFFACLLRSDSTAHQGGPVRRVRRRDFRGLSLVSGSGGAFPNGLPLGSEHRPASLCASGMGCESK